MKSEYIQLIIAASTIFGGLIGYLIKYWLEKNKDLLSENTRLKRDNYKKFISLILNLIKNSGADDEIAVAKLKDEIYSFYEDHLLYSSPGVILAYADYMQYLYDNEGKDMKVKHLISKLGKIIQQIRKELGLSNRKLGKNSVEVFRAMFKDFNTIQNGK